jgi:hypothetical protein
MAVKVRFCSLTGKFSVGDAKTFSDFATAKAAVIAYASEAGYTNVSTVEDEDSLRFTAKTPGGRSGRNVAFLEDDFSDEY